MPRAQSPILRRIGQLLHEHFDGVSREPIPQRWVDLIDYLNHREHEGKAKPQKV
jgi:hypothetical protein